MRLSVLLLFFIWACVCRAEQAHPETGEQGEARVPFFSVTGEPAIRALLRLARQANAPLGIVEDDDRLCKSLVTYSGADVLFSAAVQAVVAQVPGYDLHRVPGSPVILIAPVSPRPVTTRFLGLVDRRFGPITGTLQRLMVALWVHIRYILHPDQGTAVSILSSTDDPEFRVEAENATVEQILNRIASASRASWVLRPLPQAMQKLGSEVPYAMFSTRQQLDSGEAERCVAITE